MSKFRKYLNGIRLPAVVAASILLASCGQDQRMSSSTEALSAKVAELEAKLRYQIDRQQISDVFARYARGFDRQDAAVIQSAFWPGAQFNFGKRTRTIERVIETDLPAFTGLGSYGHHMTTQTVDIDGDVAHVEMYVMPFMRTQDNKVTMIDGGRYIDRLERRNGEWRIAIHEYIPHAAVDASSAYDSRYGEEMYPRSGCWLGTRDKRDLSYQRPLPPRANPDVGHACTE